MGAEQMVLGKPDGNGRHERMHGVLKAAMASPSAANWCQQVAFGSFPDKQVGTPAQGTRAATVRIASTRNSFPIQKTHYTRTNPRVLAQPPQLPSALAALRNTTGRGGQLQAHLPISGTLPFLLVCGHTGSNCRRTGARPCKAPQRNLSSGFCCSEMSISRCVFQNPLKPVGSRLTDCPEPTRVPTIRFGFRSPTTADRRTVRLRQPDKQLRIGLRLALHLTWMAALSADASASGRSSRSTAIPSNSHSRRPLTVGSIARAAYGSDNRTLQAICINPRGHAKIVRTHKSPIVMSTTTSSRRSAHDTPQPRYIPHGPPIPVPNRRPRRYRA